MCGGAGPRRTLKKLISLGYKSDLGPADCWFKPAFALIPPQSSNFLILGGLDPYTRLLSVVRMRTFEVIVALICAVILFTVLKIIGLVIKFALIAAVLGFAAGLLLARMLRPKS